MKSFAKKLRRPPLRSAYHRLQGCDCPECQPQTRLEKFLFWLDSPPGPWCTYGVIVLLIGLVALYCWLLPGTPGAATAVKG